MLNHVKSEILRMGQNLNQLLYEVLAREAREKSARERTGEFHLAKE
jgi:hypothetical protein